MAVPSTVADLDAVAANNSPTGSESIGTNLDDYLRSHAAIIKQVSNAGLKTASNLSDLASAATARTNLGIGNGGAVNTANNVVVLDSSGKLPAVDGSSLTGLSNKQIQPITASVGSNALTLTLNATSLDFRSSTLSSGTVNTRTVSSPISVVVSSGSTLGTVNAQAARLAVIAIDNAGTVELAVTNIAGGVNLDETTLISTTAEGGAGAADSANVVYSTTARTSVPFRVVGFVDITEATAGTWATAPSTIQGVGGQALAAMSSLGYGQTWQDVKTSPGRSVATTYYNTTGKPIVVALQYTYGATNATGLNIQINSSISAYGSASSNTSANSGSCQAIIPPGSSYQALQNSGTATLTQWFELR